MPIPGVRVGLKVLLVFWIIYTIFFLVYMFTEYLFNPSGNWKVLPNICCDLIKKVPLYLHIIGATIILIFGPIQLINNVYKTRIHPYTGIIYLTGFIFASGGGLTFIWFNGTTAGLWMTIPFIIYGILMLIYPALMVYYAVTNQIKKHQQWAIRTYMLGNGSVLYRTLYQFTCYVLIKCNIITFTGTLDYVFDWLFFLIPIIISELYLLLVNYEII